MNEVQQELKDSATREGFEAYVKRATLSDNPYAKSTKANEWWRKGWTNAQSYEKPNRGNPT